MIIEEGAAEGSPALPEHCLKCSLSTQACKCPTRQPCNEESAGLFSTETLVEIGEAVTDVADNIVGGIGDTIQAIFD